MAYFIIRKQVHYVSVWFSAKLCLLPLWLEHSMAAHPVSATLCPNMQEHHLHKRPGFDCKQKRNVLETFPSACTYKDLKRLEITQQSHVAIALGVAGGHNGSLCNAPKRRWMSESDRRRSCWWGSGRSGFACVFFFLWVDGGVAFAALSSCSAVRRAGSGMLVLFAHVEHAALNPPVVLFSACAALGPWRLIHYGLHTHAQREPVVLGQQPC